MLLGCEGAVEDEEFPDGGGDDVAGCLPGGHAEAEEVVAEEDCVDGQRRVQRGAGVAIAVEADELREEPVAGGGVGSRAFGGEDEKDGERHDTDEKEPN